MATRVKMTVDLHWPASFAWTSSSTGETKTIGNLINHEKLEESNNGIPNQIHHDALRLLQISTSSCGFLLTLLPKSSRRKLQKDYALAGLQASRYTRRLSSAQPCRFSNKNGDRRMTWKVRAQLPAE